MNSFYSKFTKRKFDFFTIIVCLIGDLSLMAYLYTKFADKERYQNATRLAEVIAKQINPSMKNAVIPPEHWQGLYEVLINTMLTSFALIFVLHLIVYFLFLKGAAFASSYLKLVAWFGALGCFLLGIDSLFSFSFPAVLFLILSLAYFLVARGFSVFKQSLE